MFADDTQLYICYNAEDSDIIVNTLEKCTAPVALRLACLLWVRKVLGSIPAGSHSRLKSSTQCRSAKHAACTSRTEEGKAMCSKPPVEACHFSVVHIVWCSEGPCEPSNEYQFADLGPEPPEMEYRVTDFTFLPCADVLGISCNVDKNLSDMGSLPLALIGYVLINLTLRACLVVIGLRKEENG